MDTLDAILDPELPDRLRAMAGDLEKLAGRTRRLLEGLRPPPTGSPLAVAHAYAITLQARAADFLAWVDSPAFPPIAARRRDQFRTAAGRLLTSGRRLAAATERRRVDELIERAAEAMQQADEQFLRASAGVMRDVQQQVGAALGRKGGP
ncbi:MAG: hypothetical protein JWM18_4479 [Chloroflexi bacterium]|nr:hypothetical protein [Chloroflexota bacterium]